MYRFYLIILFSIVTVASTFAQKTVDRETYESAVDHLNCELAKFYMLKNQGEYVHQEYLDSLALFPCNFEHLMVFIQERQPQLENNGYLSVYIESFKEEFDNQITNGALYNNLMDIFKQELLIEYEGSEAYEDLKFTLKGYLEETLKIHELATNNGIKDTQVTSSKFWDWFSGINLLLLIVALFFLFFAITILRWAIKYWNTGKDKISISQELNADRRKQKIAENTATSTQTINEKLKPKPPKTAPKEVITKTIELEEEVPQSKEVKEEPKEPKEPEEAVFYMHYPSIDGSFYQLESTKKQVPGESAFKFKLINEKYALATFEILNDDKIITDIFMDYDRTIKSVCEIEGNPKQLNKVIRPGIVKIIMVEPGTVQKTSQHWRLKKKAVIRFEYE